MKSRNIIFTAPSEVSVVEEYVPELKAGQALCRAKYSLISTGTELRCLLGIFDKDTNWASWVQYPFAPGYSMVAEVERVAGVGKASPGDIVYVKAPHSEYFVANEEELYPVPGDVRAEDATFMTVAMTAQQGVRRAALELGNNIAVAGAGLIGQLVILYLNMMGARRIVAIDQAEERLEFARKSGATHTICASAQDARKHIEELTDGRMMDVVFENTGIPTVLSETVRLCRAMAKIVLLGDTTVPTQQYLGPDVVKKSITILGTHLTNFPQEYSVFAPWSKDEMTDLIFEFIGQKRYDVASLISHRVSPCDAADVYKDLQHSRLDKMGVLFDWTTMR